MIVVGLTGPIGSGKSNIVQALIKQGIACFDADACVYTLFERPETITSVSCLAPSAIKGGRVDRNLLAEEAFGNDALLGALETLLHPLVWDECQRFLTAHRNIETPLVILDVPLLFETGYTKLCNSIIVLDCPKDILTQRVLARPGMTNAKFEQILRKQGSWEEKSKQADYVLDTSGLPEQTLSNLNMLLEGIKKRLNTMNETPNKNHGIE